MKQSLIRAFWGCGETALIDFAVHRARLNRKEKEVLTLILDDCMTQERAAEEMDISVRRLQDIWYSAQNKLLSIPWVVVYAEHLSK